MGLITKELNRKLENYEYLEDILSELENLQKENNYINEKIVNDLDVAL